MLATGDEIQNTIVEAQLNPAALSRLAAELFADAPVIWKRLQILRPYICPFHELLAFVPPDSIHLDIGCGGGLFLGLLTATGRLRYGKGFDLSPAAIATARQMVEQLERKNCKTELVFEVKSATDSWPDGKYDVVSIIDVMHHLPPAGQEKMFANVTTHLRPGGLLLYKDMVSRPLWRAWANRLHDLALARQWIHYLPVEKAEQLAHRAGLIRIAARRINMLWYGHDLRLFQRGNAANVSENVE